MKLGGHVVQQRLEAYQKRAPAEAKRLLDKAALGDLGAADQLAKEAGVSRLDALDGARQLAEGRVFDVGGARATQKLVGALSESARDVTRGGLGAGGTVAHLGGFRDVVLPPERTLAKLEDKLVRGGSLSTKDRAEAERALRSAVGGQLDEAALAKLSRAHASLLSALGGVLAGTDGADVAFVSSTGALVKRTVEDAEGARALLRELNGAPESVPGASYALRGEIMKRGGVASFEAYTYGGVDVPGRDVKSYVDRPEVWLPQRRALHEEQLLNASARAAELSAAIKTEQPTIFAMRGNTAAGKTRSVKQIDVLQGALAVMKREPKAAVNPDNFKKELVDRARVDGLGLVGHQQTHVEGSMLTRKLWAELETDQASSAVIDRRLGPASDLDEIVQSAAGTHKRVQVFDIDAPLEMSLCGVLTRAPGGDDPIPPFSAIAHGFREVREERRRVMLQAIESDVVDRYELFHNREDGERVHVASVAGGDLKVHDAQAFEDVCAPTARVIEKVAATVIDDAFIGRMTRGIDGGFRDVMRAALERYRGQTLAAAVDAHGGTP